MDSDTSIVIIALAIWVLFLGIAIGRNKDHIETLYNELNIERPQ